jgi:oligopeptide/dipeptide ABC transporter ATP-binding protein
MAEPILEVRDLVTEIRTRRGHLGVVNGVSLKLYPGEIVGLVGESGSGKSMTSYSIMQLFPTSQAKVSGGQILFEGQDLRTARPAELRKLRGNRLSMIFQDPSSFLDPLMPIGKQVAETILSHKPQSKAAAEKQVLELLARLGLPDTAELARRYPHELSGGQKQRVLIATAIACQPSLLIADEPTTALDVTIQAQILDLLRQLRDQMNLAILLITHDLGVVAETCDRVYVMYASRIIEENETAALFKNPRHPYTRGLLQSTLSVEAYRSELFSIPGSVPSLANLPQGCYFRPRCPLADEKCLERPPLMGQPGSPARSACWHTDRLEEALVWKE